MKINLAASLLMALGASVAGVGALDAVPHLLGGYTDLTRRVLSECAGLHQLGDPIVFDGAGTGAAEK